MARLGVPMNIREVRAKFRQPLARLNPLGLRFRAPIGVILRRGDAGGHSFYSFWESPAFLGPPKTLLRRRTLVPLIRELSGLFAEQLDGWAAFDYDGIHRPEIDAEIKAQLAEYARRFPVNRQLWAAS